MSLGIVVAFTVGVPVFLVILALIAHYRYDGKPHRMPGINWPVYGDPEAVAEQDAANRPIGLDIAGRRSVAPSGREEFH